MNSGDGQSALMASDAAWSTPQAVTRVPAQKRRFELLPLKDIQISTAPSYLIKGLLPKTGLTIVWGPPKSGKSFWVLDVALHIALGRPYRGRRVQQGPVVYVAAEGEHGFRARIAAFRIKYDLPDGTPFFLVAARPNLVADRSELVESIRDCLGAGPPALVVLDTLNRTMAGSESSDEDMTAYIRAVDAIVDAFHCSVIVVHHSGVAANRPRGHTSLSGAADAQIAIAKDGTATLELVKDGAEGEVVDFGLETIEVGIDHEGDPITSCVVVDRDGPTPSRTERGSVKTEARSGDNAVTTRMSRAQSVMLKVLKDAGSDGLHRDDWNELARAEGIGMNRPATLNETRRRLEKMALVSQTATGNWIANS